MEPTRISITNSVLADDFVASLDEQLGHGILDVDLKDHIFGKDVMALSDGEAQKAADLISERGMKTYCLSTVLFDDDVELGADHFRRSHVDAAVRAGQLAQTFEPTFVRFMAASSSGRPAGLPLLDHLDASAPWLLESYASAIAVVVDAGFAVTIENEIGGCLLATSSDMADFFRQFPNRSELGLTWDVQNMWSAGEFPSSESYRRLRDVIGYVHVKGGTADEANNLKWRSSLQDAAWPVVEIIRLVIADGVSPVICVNPCHGEPPTGYDGRAVALDDIRFLREITRQSRPF